MALKNWTRLAEGDGRSPRSLLVTSYFTDPFYEREAFQLARSCQAHGLDYVITEAEDGGSWAANTNHKPRHLRDVAVAYPKRDILWLDADARIRQYPQLLYQVDTPIAYHRWRDRQVASGTVLLTQSEERLQILERWILECETYPDLTDQVCLGQVLNDLRVESTELPVEYCWIWDFNPWTGKARSPTLGESPVIEHLQASRWTRNKKG